jgi:hypothetical protein
MQTSGGRRMSNYKRLTERTKHGIAVLDSGERFVLSCGGYATTKALNRLAELEDKIENGTLVELPCKVGDNAVAIIDTLCYPNAIYNVKLKDLAYIVEDENGDVTFQHITRIFGTEAEAEKRLEELKNE